MVVVALWLFLTVPCVGQQCVIVVYPDHTHLLFGGYEQLLRDVRHFINWLGMGMPLSQPVSP